MNANSSKPIRKVRAVMGAGLSLTGLAGVIVWLAQLYQVEVPWEVALFLAAALTSVGTSAAGYLARSDIKDLLVLEGVLYKEEEGLEDHIGE